MKGAADLGLGDSLSNNICQNNKEKEQCSYDEVIIVIMVLYSIGPAFSQGPCVETGNNEPLLKAGNSWVECVKVTTRSSVCVSKEKEQG